MKRSGLIILAIVAVLVIWGISVQRGLVGVDEDVKEAGAMFKPNTNVGRTWWANW